LPKVFFSRFVNQIDPSGAAAMLTGPWPVLEPEQGGLG